MVGGEWNLSNVRGNDACLELESPSQSIFIEGCHLNHGQYYQPLSDQDILNGWFIDYPDIIVFRNNNVASYDIYFQKFPD